MLDEVHPFLPQNYEVDNNNYVLGRIGSHNIVLACLPDGVMDTTLAAIVAHQMRSIFQNIRFGLMAGIDGGAPSRTDDIRLRDIIVGLSRRGGSDVIQYDFGKTVQDGKLLITSSLNRPPDALLTAINNPRSEHLLLGHKLKVYLDKKVDQYPRLKSDFSHYDSQPDHLYQSEFRHPTTNRTCTTYDQTKTIPAYLETPPNPSSITVSSHQEAKT
ncbi:hypothetical protein BDV12DRAFT_142006 [Aspergillus spectabilis]